MKNSGKVAILGAAIAATSAYQQPVTAQVGLEEVIVTARRREESLQ